MTPRVLLLTQAVWDATVNALAPYSRARVEGGCLWYGRRESDTATALVVGIPKQENTPFRFRIPAAALEELNRRVPDDLVVVAQVHSHPGRDTTHSPWDDDLVVSHKIFSLVVPNYAALPCPLAGTGIHVYEGRRWAKLPPADRERVRITPALHAPGYPVVVDAR